MTRARDIADRNVDSTTIDGVDSTQLLRSDVADTKTAGDLSFADNVKATFGAGSDLQIYHDGNNSLINDVGTGDLRLRSNGSGVIVEMSNGNDLAQFLNGSGEAKLMHNGSEKLSTTSGGVQVTGSVITDRLVIEDDGSSSPLLQLMADDQSPWALRIGNSTYSTGNHGILSYVGNTGGGIIQSQGNGAYQTLTFNQSDDSLVRAMMQMNATGSVRLFYQGNEKLYTKSDGIDVTGEVQADSLDIDGTADISGQTNFHSNVVLDDNNKLYIGNGLDLQIYHDGSNSYIDEQGTGNLLIRGTQIQLKASDGTSYAEFNDGGASNLRYSGDLKLATTSSGVSVTGTVAATSFTGDGSSLTGIAAGATGGGSDEIFWENGQTVTSNYTITNGKNAMSAGPITINTGVTVTVGTGETWTVV